MPHIPHIPTIYCAILHTLNNRVGICGMGVMPNAPFLSTKDAEITLKGQLSWSETDIIGVDNQIELKKLCGFKKKSKSKD